MKQLARVQFFTWLGLFCMWLHFSNAVSLIFGATDTQSPLFKAGAEWAGVCYATMLLGAIGLLAIGFIHGEEQKGLLLGVLAWASILSMPYAMLAGALPAERMGVYMGIFNFFIVLPEIPAALTFGPAVENLLEGNLIYAVMAGGVFMAIAAILTFFVPRTQLDAHSLQEVAEEEGCCPRRPRRRTRSSDVKARPWRSFFAAACSFFST